MRGESLKHHLIAAVLLAGAGPLSAQLNDPGEPRVLRSEIQLQAIRFGNFFQARGGAPEEDVNAAGVEYRATYRFEAEGPDFHGAAYVLNYDERGTETSFGGRFGVSRYGSVHWYNVYLDHMQNGYAFDIDETTANADITALAGSYSYRLTRDWRIGVDSYNEWQRFDVETGFENEYVRLQAEARYRGFGRIFEPRVGVATARRNVQNARDSYDEPFWFVQLRSRPNPRLDLSLRYRDRTRDYRTIDRTEDRDQVTFRADFRQTSRMAWTAMVIYEDVNSSLPGRDFDTSRLFTGFTFGF